VLFPVRLDDAVSKTKEVGAVKLRDNRNIGDFFQMIIQSATRPGRTFSRGQQPGELRTALPAHAPALSSDASMMVSTRVVTAGSDGSWLPYSNA
jgi:hypothetical protein